MGVVSISEDEEDRRNEAAHEKGVSKVLLPAKRRHTFTRDMSPADMRKVLVRQARDMDTLERELIAARLEIAKLSEQLGRVGWEARSLKRRLNAGKPPKPKRRKRVVTVTPGTLK